jgi:hypothetical protein
MLASDFLSAGLLAGAAGQLEGLAAHPDDQLSVRLLPHTHRDIF